MMDGAGMPATDLAQAAVEYAARSWHILPLKPGTKGGHYLPNGFKDASCDPAIVEGWWQRWPNANIGLSLAASGLVAVDVDSHKPDCEWAAWSLGLDLGDTLVQRSASGGFHYIYTAEADGSFAGTCCAGVDVKSQGYVLIEPSTFNGGQYQWQTDDPPLPAPDWIPRKGQKEMFAAGVGEISQADQNRVLDLLTSAPNTLDRADWVRLAMGCKTVLGDAGREPFLAYSYRHAEPQKPAEPERVWRTVSGQSTVGVGTLLHLLCPADESPDWLVDGKGRPIWCASNADVMMRTHADWRGVLGFDTFAVKRVLRKPIPGQPQVGEYPRPLADSDYNAALIWFNQNGFPLATMATVVGAVQDACARGSFDPLINWLDSLIWDGKPRLCTWLSDYLGVAPSDYSREVGLRWAVGAIARAFEPGCKNDTLLVMEGKQGARKSSALAALAGADYFSDALPAMGTKDAASFLRGVWICEIAELNSMKREVDAIKAFVSRQVERYRPSYGREEITEPRRTVFCGTTNLDNWQQDVSGGRRFWPVKVGRIDLRAIRRDRNQIWAEAVALYRKGERWWLEGAVEEQAALEIAYRGAEDDPWTTMTLDAVAGHSEIAIAQCLHHIGVPHDRRKRGCSNRVADILRKAGWVRNGQFTSGQFKGQARYRAD